MKRFKGLAILMLLVTTMAFVACEGGSPEANNTSTAPPSKTEAGSDMVDKEHNSKYICPMYCEGSGSDHAGDCPVCHMHYVENKDYKGAK